ncbi:MAG TPA: hypothetical protein VFE33_08725 [Thermoanaerobaculia bacterium]|nr:hypothetical protein [Thermoanaerobaculia bacterium]
MLSITLSTLVCALLTTAPAPPVASLPASTEINCDGFGYVCGQTLPLCGCGCVPAASTDACMKNAKDAGQVASCVDGGGARGYCAL